jgi:hypothetical protein
MKPLLDNMAVNSNPPAYSARTPDYYVEQIDARIREGLSPEQLTAIRAAIETAMPRPAPKIVDLRVNVDLIFTRFYVVLFVGKERRKNPRAHTVSGVTAVTNKFAAIGLLVGLNLTVSIFIFLMAYLIKSALGINLLQHHLSDYLG